MSHYMAFSKSQFEYYLTKNKNELAHLLSWRELSEELSSDIQINEYVYEYKTSNPAGFIIVFSSIEKEIGKARVKGSDAVRLVFRWNIMGQSKYHKIRKMQRIESFFDNFKETLENTKKDTGFNGFKKIKDWKDKLQDIKWI